MAKATKAGKPNIFRRFTGYLTGVWSEFKRVVWPTRPEVLNSSVVVIATLLFFIAFTLIVDSAVIAAISFVSRIGG